MGKLCPESLGEYYKQIPSDIQAVFGSPSDNAKDKGKATMTDVMARRLYLRLYPVV